MNEKKDETDYSGVIKAYSGVLSQQNLSFKIGFARMALHKLMHFGRKPDDQAQWASILRALQDKPVMVSKYTQQHMFNYISGYQ